MLARMIFLCFVVLIVPNFVRADDNPKERKISSADRARIAELLRLATADLREAKGSLITRSAADIALQTKIGEDAAAIQSFAWAKELIGRDTIEFRELAKASARAGDVATVLRLTRDLPQTLPNWTQPNFRDTVLSECAEEVAKIHRLNDANEIIDQIENADQIKFVKARAERAHVQELARTRSIAEALKHVESVQEPDEKVRLLAGNLYRNFTFTNYPQEPGIALRQAKAGDRPGAENSLERASSFLPQIPQESQSGAAASISGAYSQMGELAKAEHFLQLVKNPVWLPHAQAAYLKALAQARKTKEAEALLAKLDKEILVHALYHYGVGQFQAGDRAGAKTSFARAHQILGGLPNSVVHEHNLISAQASGGDATGALAALGDTRNQSVRISNIVYSLARSGEYAEARKAAERLPIGEWWRGRCFRAVAKVQTARGKQAEALSWVNQLPSTYDKGNALLGIAEGLADPGSVNER